MRKEVRYADFPIRLIAFILDGLLLMPIGIVLEGSVGLFYEALVGLILSGSYYTLFVSGPWQATPGKRIMGIHVIHQSGRKLEPKEALERYLAYLIPSLPLYSSFASDMKEFLILWLSVAWFIPVWLTRQKTGVHDLLCQTRVIHGKL